MSEKIILELPEEVARRAHETSERTGRSLESILIDWLEQSAAQADIYPLHSDTEYTLYTPYGNETAAQVLMDFLETSKGNDEADGKD